MWKVSLVDEDDFHFDLNHTCGQTFKSFLTLSPSFFSLNKSDENWLIAFKAKVQSRPRAQFLVHLSIQQFRNQHHWSDRV